MALVLDAIGRRAGGKAATRGRLRTLVWGLHVSVSVWAVFSLLCNGFNWWVDWRLLGGMGQAAMKIFWVGTVLVVPSSAGPRLTGLGRPTWVNAGWSAACTRLLLWPTYVVMGCLAANTLWYYRLLMKDQVDAGWPVPMTLIALMVLGTWVLTTREWVRVNEKIGATSAATRRTQMWACAFGVVMVGAATGFFLLESFARPMTEPVDVAVVLGNRVMPDGTASVTLRDRTMAAVQLYKRGVVGHVILSGAVWPPVKEGGPALDEVQAMRKVCLDNGVPDSAIVLDPVGENTRATAFDAKRIMQEHGWKSVVVCTDQYHLYRTVKSFREVGVEAFTARSWPEGWRCADIHATLREIVAIGVYTLRPGYHEPRILGMKLKDAKVVVRKTAGVLEILDGGTLVKKFACITGGNAGDKAVEGDRRTPVGIFHVVFKNPDSKFHLSLGLDYPRREDAERGLKSGLITREQYAGIVEALGSDLSLVENQKKLWYTPLGGEIFIHGNAEGRTGTAGCVALSNLDIEEIYGALEVGTVVEIRP